MSLTCLYHAIINGFIQPHKLDKEQDPTNITTFAQQNYQILLEGTLYKQKLQKRVTESKKETETNTLAEICALCCAHAL